MLPDQRTEPAAPEAPRRRFRKLRIAWSVWWSVVAVLMIAMWVRSHTWWDELYTPTSVKRYYLPDSDSGMVVVESASGQAIVYFPTGSGDWIWHISGELKGTYWLGHESPEQNRDKGIAGFAVYKMHGLYRTLRVPYWFLVVAAMGLAGVPWIRWSKRFSLRTLLIATTLVAAVLGLSVWAAR